MIIIIHPPAFVPATDLTPTHPEWVGAWWLGFLVFGAMATLAPVFLWWFPRRLSPRSPDRPPPPAAVADRRLSSLSPAMQVDVDTRSRSAGATRKTPLKEGVRELKGRDFLLYLIN